MPNMITIRPGVHAQALRRFLGVVACLACATIGLAEPGNAIEPYDIDEDMAMQESMGTIHDRSKEHLGASDTAISRMRRTMLDGVRRFEEGAPPVGLAERVDYANLSAEESMRQRGTPWQITVPV